EMAHLRALLRREAGNDLVLVDGAILPERPPYVPGRTKPILVRDRVLDDDRAHPFGMCDCQAHSDRPAVILLVEDVIAESDDLREVVHDLRKMVEGVAKRGRRRGVAL